MGIPAYFIANTSRPPFLARATQDNPRRSRRKTLSCRGSVRTSHRRHSSRGAPRNASRAFNAGVSLSQTRSHGRRASTHGCRPACSLAYPVIWMGLGAPSAGSSGSERYPFAYAAQSTLSRCIYQAVLYISRERRLSHHRSLSPPIYECGGSREAPASPTRGFICGGMRTAYQGTAYSSVAFSTACQRFDPTGYDPADASTPAPASADCVPRSRWWFQNAERSAYRDTW